PALRLVVTRGPDRGQNRQLDREELVVGTSPAADLVLTDPTVSRNHAVLRVLDEGYLVTDLGSTNGTRLAERRVQSAYAEPRDCLELGATRIRLDPVRSRVELPLSEADSFGRLIGRSVAMRRLFALLEQVAAREVTVLLVGETGTGKDAAAEALHERS